jgi:DNA-binding MarR family transcriptional regulator
MPEPLETIAPPALAPALADITGYLLRRAYLRALEVAGEDFSPGQHPRRLAVLMALKAATRPTSQTVLSTSLGVNRTLMGRLVDELEADGLVERERSPTDRRSYAVKITPAGREAVKAAGPGLARSDRRLTAALTRDERARLNALLRELLATEPGRNVPPALADRTGFLISQAHFVMRDRGDRALAALGLEIRHFGTLAVIGGAPGMSQQQMARELGITPPVVVPVVDELEGMGLVRRRRSAGDRRSYALGLTPDGERALAAARDELDRLTLDVFEAPGGASGAELRRLLRRLLGAEG